jgi:hypothetical protein
MEAVTAPNSSKTIKIANAFYTISRSIHRLIKACCQFARAVSSMTASVTTSLKYRVCNIFEALPGLESPASRGVLGSLGWDRKPRKSRKNVPYLSERNFKFREPHKVEKSFPDQIKVFHEWKVHYWKGHSAKGGHWECMKKISKFLNTQDAINKTTETTKRI